ncbi:hypothetical protein BDW42DRAFT_181936 [Aspergillus taichungensis]|uniref:Uncharacterized protein n=1 Tax=Aspergillus taichungensis TaxID=482145 RepID=A0A2J5HCX2_9EURO|nr:hypothetical protein BDW42DRAFT_181936 [Aspergillus taichungensis]
MGNAQKWITPGGMTTRQPASKGRGAEPWRSPIQSSPPSPCEVETTSLPNTGESYTEYRVHEIPPYSGQPPSSSTIT